MSADRATTTSSAAHLALVTAAGITLRRRSGRAPSISTDRSDMLVLTLPDRISDEQARAVVLRHYDSVHRWLTHAEAAPGFLPLAKEMVAGEGFLLHGRSRRLRWRQPTSGFPAEFDEAGSGGFLHLDPALADDWAAAAAAVVDCYSRHTVERVADRYPHLAERLGLPPLAAARTTNREGSTWASVRAVNAGLSVTAHWALVQFDVSSFDLLLARVLCARAGRDVRALDSDRSARRRMQEQARDLWTGELAG